MSSVGHPEENGWDSKCRGLKLVMGLVDDSTENQHQRSGKLTCHLLHDTNPDESLMEFHGQSDSSDSDSSDSSDSSSDDEELGWTATQFALFMCIVLVAMTSGELFDPTELLLEGQSWVRKDAGVTDRFFHMRQSPSFFRTLTNFTLTEYEELCQLVVPTISAHARHTGLLRKKEGRPSKLQPEQRLLSFILYMKHANSVAFDAFDWNWSKSSLCDDAMFIGSCLNEAISNEIRWPTLVERRDLATCLLDFPGCIGIIDGTLVRIRRPKDARRQRVYYNGRKKFHCMNNTIIVDHHGLIIHLDLGYPGSMHDSSILKYSEVDRDWRQFFVHDPPYIEYLLGDPGYIGNDRYIVRRFSAREIAPGADLPTIRAYNKLHSGYRVHVEWGIGGIKRKWRRLSSTYDCTKKKFVVLFYAAALLTNFLHRRRRDYSMEIIAEADSERAGGWDGDL